MEKFIFREIKSDEMYLFEQIRPIHEYSFESGIIEDSWDDLVHDFNEWQITRDLPSSKRFRKYVIGAILGEKLVGFTNVKFFHDFSYVNYLAVAKNFRNRSITTGLCQKIIEISLKDAGEFHVTEPIIFGEARKPELARNEKERRAFLRVNKIWQHIGLHLLDVEYFAPDKSREVRQLRLMIYPLAQQEYISSNILLRRLKLLYELEYHLHPFEMKLYLDLIKKSIKGRKKIYGIPQL